ncbi:hypothetical protein BJX66DRAFT_294066 [Aspergillus keveii]|uniref:Uncharacterized protein n=1 Tax=Aspergillus keveii TaxID=714993 RepID=A0ABR4GJF6_9EURO
MSQVADGTIRLSGQTLDFRSIDHLHANPDRRINPVRCNSILNTEPASEKEVEQTRYSLNIAILGSGLLLLCNQRKTASQDTGLARVSSRIKTPKKDPASLL